MNTDGLAKITGTEEVGGLVRLISGKVSGRHIFINSFSEHPYSQKEICAGKYLRQGNGFRVTNPKMPKDFLDNKPQCNQGGEIVYIIEGEYFDADMKGVPIREYAKGSIVFYGIGSTNRRLSRFGADILCITFDNPISGENSEDLINKMVEARISDKAVEYAMMWMIPKDEERRELKSRLKLP